MVYPAIYTLPGIPGHIHPSWYTRLPVHPPWYTRLPVHPPWYTRPYTTLCTPGTPYHSVHLAHARRYPVVVMVRGDRALGSNLGITMGRRPLRVLGLSFLLQLLWSPRADPSGSPRIKHERLDRRGAFPTVYP